MIEILFTSLIEKAKLYITALMAISLALFLPSAVAGNITLASPEKVNLLENFSVNVDYKSNDILDIKIGIQDNASKVYSEIYDSGWKSSFYYLPGKYPSQKEYSLRAKKSGEGLSLCVRFRKGNKVLPDKACNLIIISDVREIQNEDTPEILRENGEKPIEEEKKEISAPAEGIDNSERMPYIKRREIINLTASKREELDNAEASYASAQEKLNYVMIMIFPLALLIILSYLVYKVLRKI